MTWALLGAALLALLLFRTRIFSISTIPMPSPAQPAAKVTPVCALPPVTIPRQAVPLVLNGIQGGQYHADVIVVTGTSTITAELTLLARLRLEVTGKIERGATANPQAPGVAITLACSEGDVLIAAGAKVGGGVPPARPTPPPYGDRLAQGAAGANGGSLLIIGVNVRIAGEVEGHQGGKGAIAESGPGTFHGGPPPGSSVAVAGSGGWGGDVVICATDSILVSGTVIGSPNSDGGWADAKAHHEGDAYARGGDGGSGSDVILRGHGATCQVGITGSVLGPPMFSEGGHAVAMTYPQSPAAPARANSGRRLAHGGRGATGGTIRFIDCKVDNRGLIQSGAGGKGGDASARGGDAGANGKNGDTVAYGGNGGPGGAIPDFIDLTDQPQQGTQGNHGGGGDALAEPGMAAVVVQARATGGSNGAGTAAQPDVSLPLNPANSAGVPWP